MIGSEASQQAPPRQSPTNGSHVQEEADPLPPGGVELQLNSQSLAFVEELYRSYLSDPGSVPPDWRQYFVRMGGRDRMDSLPRSGPSFPPRSLFHAPPAVSGNGRQPGQLDFAILQERVDQLIRNYRMRGHIMAQIDPLDQPRPHPPELDPEYYGFTEADLDRPFSTFSTRGPNLRTLREIVQWLRSTYCRAIGVQFMHIEEIRVREWLQDRMEGTENRITLRRDEQLRILRRLTEAVTFEEFIQKKYLGAKSFSLEGAESLIPLLDMAIERAAADGVQEIVMGMAHRGRLNVLANIMQKKPRDIFREFEDKDPELHVGRGDVKYHLGYSCDWKTSSGRNVHISLAFNPSHLEFVNPVVLGRMRSKQDRFGDSDRRHGMALLIHGDAAFAGEGVVQETLNLSELAGYKTGGTIHVVVNNQIGFTTSPQQSRSSIYATDVARLLQVPIFHVNGEDPEAVAQAVRLALDFRKAFQKDVVIDMYCYRLRGHNEGDEPSFTQPLMYQYIARHKSVRENYLEHLLNLGGVVREEAERMIEERTRFLEDELTIARSDTFTPKVDTLAGIWSGYEGGKEATQAEIETGVDRDRLVHLLDAQSNMPEDFHPHPKVERLLTARREMLRGERPLDWSTAESLAFASLVTQGIRVRLTGQDSERGTFSQRHSVLHDVQDGHVHVPLQHLSPDQGPIEIRNSSLSEVGVLGFEYGYSLDCPEGLVMWEAQFGDFVNVAQVIIDQFIVSAEDKWRRLSGLVLLLPHGFEGQGPEHSSARLERFLMTAAEDNIQIVYPTTPAQYFHLLRRQVLRRWRKPLVVMTPKSLLRSPQCVSTFEDLAQGTFQRVMPDSSGPDPKQVSRILLCTGKIYYELDKYRQDRQRSDVAIVRLEELYPLPEERLREALAPYADGTPVHWVQEEPENMGAWRYLRVQFCEKLLERFPFSGVSRPASASPATGSATSHRLEQQQVLTQAFGD